MHFMETNLKQYFVNFVESLQAYNLLSDEEKETIRDNQENEPLEVRVWKLDWSDRKRFEALLSFGWPNVWVNRDSDTSWWTYEIYRASGKFIGQLTNDEIDTFIQMYDVYTD